MSWTAPRTFVTGEVETAAIFNTHLRDNMLALQPQAAAINTVENRTNVAYGDLATVGPAVTALTGATVLCTVGAYADNNGGVNANWMGVTTSGASTIAANDPQAFMTSNVASSGGQGAFVFLLSGLTPGTNTFTAKYRATAGTGRWGDRIVIVEACF